MADRIVVMNAGRPEQVGTPQEIYQHPATPFVAGFIGKANMLEGRARAGRVEIGGAEGFALDLAPPARFLDGSPVTVACRPEWMRLAPLGGAAAEGSGDRPAGNRIAAEVTFVRDVGEIREIHVRAGGTALVCDLPFSDRTPYTVGDRVLAEMPADALRVFPREPGGAIGAGVEAA